MVERFGGRYLTKAGSHEILEGDWRPNRVVIIEFPDIASIKNWYRAPEYQPLIALRRSAATDVMIILEGVGGLGLAVIYDRDRAASGARMDHGFTFSSHKLHSVQMAPHRLWGQATVHSPVK